MKINMFWKKNTNSEAQVDYLSLIDKEDVRKVVANFFEPSVIKDIPKKDLMALVKAINNETKEGAFSYSQIHELSHMHKMNDMQLKSKTHKTFLKIVENNFGKSAQKMLKQRKNINVFNLNEVHVLNQKIFDTYGEQFVNRILNTDLTPESLIIIKEILSDKDKSAEFETFYKFYSKNIGTSPIDFERMIRGYPKYRELINDIKSNGKKLSSEQKETLKEILKDHKNENNVSLLENVDSYYEDKDKKYNIEKQKGKTMFENGQRSKGVAQLANAFFKNYYGNVFQPNHYGYSPLDDSAMNIYRHFEVEDAFKDERKGKNRFSGEEKEMIRDLLDIVSSTQEDVDIAYEKLMSYCDKYEQKGNKTSRVTSHLLDKLPNVYQEQLMESLSTVEKIQERVKNKEEGISLVENPTTVKGEKIDLPVYMFDGADFAFLSTTNYACGLSGNRVEGDYAESWFEYENGTSHISCSYSTNQNLSCFEFSGNSEDDSKVTYLFDDAQLLAMGSKDISTSADFRKSDIRSSSVTKFMSPENLAEKSKEVAYNEVAVNRYDYEGQPQFSSKIIPSAILCSQEISEAEYAAAKSFTEYCVKNGLKPEGWKMPIIVVNTEKYRQMIKNNAQELIKQSEKPFTTEKEDEWEVKDEEELVENKEETLEHNKSQGKESQNTATIKKR